MKNLILALLLMSLSFSAASSDCYDSFFEQYDVLDSKAFILNDFDLKSDYQSSPEVFAKEAVSKIIGLVPSCEKQASSIRGKESNNSFGFKVSCKELMAGRFYSKSCFVESKLGYFFINMDMIGNVNLIFNRWD